FGLPGYLGGRIAEDGQSHFTLRAVENTRLAFGSEVEGGHRGWDGGSELLQAGGADDVALAVGNQIHRREKTAERRQAGVVHVTERGGEGRQLLGGRLISGKREQVVAVKQEE